MGCTTEFKGRLEFTENISLPELKYLQSILDCEDSNDALAKGFKVSELHPPRYIQFVICKDFEGIEWDGGEKFYNSEECVDFITSNMKDKYPNFGLKGFLEAQGEEHDDTWELRINDDGEAYREDTTRKGLIECPNCDHKFICGDDE